MRIFYSSLYILILSILALGSDTVHAQQSFISMSADVSFNQNDIETECLLLVFEDAPYSHYHGDCRLYRNFSQGGVPQQELIARNEVANALIDANPPLDETFVSRYYAYVFQGTDPSSVYCGYLGSELGESHLQVAFGHYQDSDLNLILPAASDCAQGPQPPSVAYCLTPSFLGCHQPGCAVWHFGYSAANAFQYRIEYKPYSYGSWTEKTVTSSTNLFPHLASNSLQWRIRGENSSGEGGWCYFWTSGECDGGGGPIE